MPVHEPHGEETDTRMTASLEESRTDVLRTAAIAAAPPPPSTRAAGRRAGAPTPPRSSQAFLASYYRLVATEDLLARPSRELSTLALAHRDFAQHRPVGTLNVRAFNPSSQDEGWSTGHTVVQIVVDDMPFLVDSVVSALGGFDRGVHLIVHPQMTVERTITGDLRSVLPEGTSLSSGDDSTGVVRESWMHVEIDRLPESSLSDLEARLRHVLENVRDSVEDWPKMRAHALTIASELKSATPPGTDPRQAREASRFLEWLAHNNFTFLGYREYALRHENGHDISVQVAGTGLGVLRYDRPHAGTGVVLTPAASRAARDSTILIITKANSRATVHRDVYLDYISIKRFNARGECIGEQRFLGLYASAAYNDTIHDIPLLDVRAEEVLRLTGLSADSHSGKDILQILETYPRDELFQTSPQQLADIATSVLHLQERRKTKLFTRRDEFGRFVSCLVYLPRDRYNTTVRLRIEALLLEAYGGETIDNTTRVSESTLARLHFVVRMPSGVDIPDVDEAALERRVIDATRTWDEDLSEALSASRGVDEGARTMAAYAKALPEAYKEDFDVETAVADLDRIEGLGEGDRTTALHLYADAAAESPEERRFKLYRRADLSLTQVLPLFTHLGVEVTDERPYEVRGVDHRVLHIFDFGLRAPAERWGSGDEVDDVRARFEDAFRAVWEGRAESDGFNALVLGAGLTWRQVVILRTVAKYLRQTGSTFSQDYVESALVAHTDIARSLVELFQTRFDPDAFDDTTEAGRDQRAARQKAIVVERQGGARRRREPRPRPHRAGAARRHPGEPAHELLPARRPRQRQDLRLPQAQPQEGPRPPRAAADVRDLGLQPARRGGAPALRQGRPRRTAVERPPRGLPHRDPRPRQGADGQERRHRAHRQQGRLLRQAAPRPRGRPRGLDGRGHRGIPALHLGAARPHRQPRLRRGGASAARRASRRGRHLPRRRGRQGHREVLRHRQRHLGRLRLLARRRLRLRRLGGLRPQGHGHHRPRRVGVGQAALPRARRRHPDRGLHRRRCRRHERRRLRQRHAPVGAHPARGRLRPPAHLHRPHSRRRALVCRAARMFELPGSSWADYDASLISKGGGIFDRSAKSVPISAAMVTALGLRAGTKSLTPAELMKAILKAPVDLLWNGGIGTYVKATSETNSEIGDRANDAIRVNGADLRCKVVGEGGNLGASQLGRIEAALAGVRVNTDAIDNSAGVDTSDHEVNIKILLTELTRSGELTMKRRNTLLASMTDEVAQQVLRDNYEQNVLLGNARAQQHEMLTVHERLIQFLEEHGDLDRGLEFLPSDAEISRRNKEGLGLVSPEFSVLVAYAKLYLKNQLIATSLPDDPWFAETLAGYFPKPLRSKYAEQIAAHPLRREIITNSVANSMVNRGGITFAYRAGEETGASPDQVARAYVVCREIFDLAGYVRQVEATDNVVSTGAQTALYLEFRRLIDRSVRWFLTSRPAVLDIAAEVARFRPGIETYAGRMPELLQGSERSRLLRRAKDLQGKGIPEDLALVAASLLDGYSLLDIIEIAEETGEKLEDVVGVYFLTSETFSIDRMLGRVTMLPRDDRWDAMARGALRDDLYAVLESLTRSVLEVSNRRSGPAERLAEWSELNADALSRARGALGGIERMTHAGIAALSVALRTLRTVTKPAASTAPATVPAAVPAAEPEAKSVAATRAEPSTQAAPSRRPAAAKKAPARKAAAAKKSAPARKAAPAKRAAPARKAAASKKAAPARKSAAAAKSATTTKTPVAASTSARRGSAAKTASTSKAASASKTSTSRTVTTKTAAKRSATPRG